MTISPVTHLDSSHLAQQEIQQEATEYIILSGGGAKGVLYSGVYAALEASGAKDTIRGIAGSSAGAISAGLIATGMNASDFEKLTSTLDMPSLLGKGVGPIFKDGKPLEKTLKDAISGNFKNFFAENDDTKIQQLLNTRLQEISAEQERVRNILAKEKHEYDHIKTLKQNQSLKKNIALSELQLKTLKALNDKELELASSIQGLEYHHKDLIENSTKLKDIISGANTEISDLRAKCQDSRNPILFKDLGLLSLLDPKKFKDLHVTAVSKKTGDLKIFNAKDSPNTEIALACKASASIPIVVKPTKIGKEKYVDGGYKDNVPFRAFRTADQQRLQVKQNAAATAGISSVEDITGDRNRILEARAKGKTLAFAFENNASRLAAYSGQRNIYEPGKIRKFISDVVVKTLARVGGKWQYTQTERDTYNEIRENSTNTVLLNPKKVGTLSFKQAKKSQEHLHATGYIQTMEHFELYKEGATKDPNLALKSAMLQIYDDIDKTQSRKFWQSKVSGANDHKRDLLKFCMPKKWDQAPEETIKEYIMTAATSPRDSKQTTETASIASMVKILNNDTISTTAKEKFAEAVFGQPIKNIAADHGITEPKDFVKNLIFSKGDMKEFIRKNPELAKKCTETAQEHKAQKHEGRGK